MAYRGGPIQSFQNMSGQWPWPDRPDLNIGFGATDSSYLLLADVVGLQIV